MTQLPDKEAKIHNALCEFELFANMQIPILIENVLLLKRCIPQDIKNPILLFLLPRAINYVVETLVLEVVQAWKILEDELKKLKKPCLANNDKDYKDLKDIRNKLIGHRVQVSLATEEYQKWYKKNYGSYEKTFELIKNVVNKITTKIKELEDAGILDADSIAIKSVKRLMPEDVNKLINTLRNAGIY